MLVFVLVSCGKPEQEVLLFGQATDSNSESIEEAKTALKALGKAKHFSTRFTEDTHLFTEDSLQQFAALIFLYTSGEALNDVQRADVERFVQAGGKLLSLDAQAEMAQAWPWYHEHIAQESAQIAMSTEQLGDQIREAVSSVTLDYDLAQTQRVPEETRFVKEILDFNLNEPMELDELPGRGLLFVERRGALKLHDFQTGATKKLAQLPLFYGNEDGLLGVAVDPNYTENNWIYLFYSAPGDEPIQRVSRFNLVQDSLLASSEKILLTIPTIRKCCHSGGALEFGPKGNLFITLGDNTNPFESSGYAPIDERPGRALWDAQKSAANTNDLRGKILRIKPEDDGTYSIPEGNLFPPGTPNTRPEIYVMGCRNPFRHSIDSKTGYLYWGDVGPDAGKTNPNRGPKGMGEFNQARQAGFWGWPYTRGNNQLYNDYDFTAEKAGEKFDPMKLVNNSPNNTGMQELPPAHASMVWFSYDASEEFPWLGKGGVNPMAGPVFHADDYAAGFPPYFENKLFVYEWMRDWVYVVTLDDDQNYVKAEAFMPKTEFSHPMDMLFGADGHLYVLEYGQKWNAQNMDARLSRIKYIEGNRTPIARMLADKTVGAVPLTVAFKGEESEDFDQDQLKYEWSFNQSEVQSTAINPSFTFDQEGIYTVQLTVIDPDGETSTTTQKIMAGNEPPKLTIETDIEDNLYWDRRKINYQVVVQDKEDGSTTDGGIDPDKVKVTLTYLPEGEDIVLATIGHQQNTLPEGKLLIDASDCSACHAEKVKVNGPSYEDIAQKYTSKDKNHLISQVIKGSSGVWGETMMAAHPQLSVDEVGKIIDYILTLGPTSDRADNGLPLAGTLTFEEHLSKKAGGKYILMASYLDQGNAAVEGSTLSASEQAVFIAPKIEAEDADERSKGLGIWKNQGATLVGSIVHNSFLKFENISFKALKSIQLAAAYNADYPYAGRVEVRAGAIDGKVLGSTKLGYSHPKKASMEYYDIPLEASEDKGPLYLVFKNPTDEDQYVLNANWISLQYDR
ncbi:MAG: PQQ-dependent sugar dehydrogenase [Saprospiraceae bacterium]|nr:PQQ-dependent sugar dehydrogenase [Saprospiraceae bacterium]